MYSTFQKPVYLLTGPAHHLVLICICTEGGLAFSDLRCPDLKLPSWLTGIRLTCCWSNIFTHTNVPCLCPVPWRLSGLTNSASQAERAGHAWNNPNGSWSSPQFRTLASNPLEQEVILAHLGSYDKLLVTGWLINNRNALLTVLETGSPRSGHIRFGVGEGSLPHAHIAPSHVLSQGGRAQAALWSFFYKGTDPIYKGSTFVTESPPNILTLGIRFQHMNFGKMGT
jgi:hypothetical protein